MYHNIVFLPLLYYNNFIEKVIKSQPVTDYGISFPFSIDIFVKNL